MGKGRGSHFSAPENYTSFKAEAAAGQGSQASVLASGSKVGDQSSGSAVGSTQAPHGPEVPTGTNAASYKQANQTAPSLPGIKQQQQQSQGAGNVSSCAGGAFELPPRLSNGLRMAISHLRITSTTFTDNSHCGSTASSAALGGSSSSSGQPGKMAGWRSPTPQAASGSKAGHAGSSTAVAPVAAATAAAAGKFDITAARGAGVSSLAADQVLASAAGAAGQENALSGNDLGGQFRPHANRTARSMQGAADVDWSILGPAADLSEIKKDAREWALHEASGFNSTGHMHGSRTSRGASSASGSAGGMLTTVEDERVEGVDTDEPAVMEIVAGPPLWDDPEGDSASHGTVDAHGMSMRMGSAQVMGHIHTMQGGTVCWDIPLSEDGSSFAPGADASRSPCGANMKLVSPPFILPAEAGESSAVGNHEGTWRMCWALFDHDPARMSLYLLRDAAGPSHTDTLPGVQTHQNAPNNGVINGPFSTIAAVPDAASHGSSSGMMFLRWRMDVQGLRCGDSSSTTAATSSSSTMGEEVAVTNVFAGVMEYTFTPHNSAWGVQALLGTAQLDHLLAHDTLRTTLTPLPPSSPSMLTHASAPQPMDVFPLHPSMVGPETALAHGSEELSTLMPAAPGAVLHQPVHDNVSTRPIAISSGSGNGDCNRQKPDGVLLKSSTAAATGSVHSGMGPLVPRAHMRGHGVEVLLAPPRLGGTAGGMVPLMSSPSPAVESCGPRAYLVSLSPRMVLVDHFLPPRLCDGLMAMASPRLIRSRVSTGTETPSRTSRSTFFTGDSAFAPAVAAVEARVSALMSHPALQAGMRPLVKSEALQVVSYSVGDFYAEHYDNKAGGQVSRAATIIIYLTDTHAGGATFFPKSTGLPSPGDMASVGGSPSSASDLTTSTQRLHASAVQRPGLRVFPARGRALVFWSRLPDGSEDLASLHSAEPVMRGEKWIATRWFREQD